MRQCEQKSCFQIFFLGFLKRVFYCHGNGRCGGTVRMNATNVKFIVYCLSHRVDKNCCHAEFQRISRPRVHTEARTEIHTTCVWWDLCCVCVCELCVVLHIPSQCVQSCSATRGALCLCACSCVCVSEGHEVCGPGKAVNNSHNYRMVEVQLRSPRSAMVPASHSCSATCQATALMMQAGGSSPGSQLAELAENWRQAWCSWTLVVRWAQSQTSPRKRAHCACREFSHWTPRR